MKPCHDPYTYCDVLAYRYDGRGHLYDLSAYDVANVKPSELSEDEKEMEKWCEEERWLELRTDVAEQNMYEEEEWKRYYQSLSEGYNSVNFSYDYNQQQEQMYMEQQQVEEKPFVVSPELQVPEGMVVPETEKINAKIIKTAKFVVEHGAQMEIIIKTKQSNNEQFCFLHFEDQLNPYYKHVFKMIKSGKYRPKEEDQEPEQDSSYEEEQPEGYLHPSLMLNRASPTPAPDIPSKPIKMPQVSIHDTPYGQLVKTFQKNYRQQDKNGCEQSTDKKPHKEQQPPVPPAPTLPYISAPEYGPAHPGLPPPPGLEPVTLPSHQPVTSESHLYIERSSPYSDDESSRDSLAMVGAPDKVVPPPPDIQPVIDRMAMYVAKNGEEFEIVVKSKQDPRFEFLEPWHMHYKYYSFKKKIHVTETAKEKKRLEKEKPKGVSFSIKGKSKEQESGPLEKRQVFDNDSSDEDGEKERLFKSEFGVIPTAIDYNHGYQITAKAERPEKPNIEISEKKQAEEKLKDRLAQAARDKMAQASKEKQIQAERKRKAAMFINMLKSTKPAVSTDEGHTKDSESGSRSHTPSIIDDDRLGDYSDRPMKSSKRSHDRHSPAPAQSSSHSKVKRSRSRSPRRRRLSPIPPSSYSKSRRSSSRSPIRRISSRPTSPVRRRDRSRSPRHRTSPGRSRSYKRSRSPSQEKSRRKENRESQSSSSSSSRKSKKKKKSRSRSRSPGHRYKPSEWIKNDPDVTIIEEIDVPPLSTENYLGLKTDTEISLRNSPDVSHVDVLSPDVAVKNERIPPPPPPTNPPPPPPPPPVDEDSNSTSSDSKSSENQKAVSQYMLSRVRAMLKASRQAVLKEEGYEDP